MKAWATPYVIIFAVLVLVGTFFMATVELLPAQVTPGPIMPGLSPIRSYDAMQGLKKIGDDVCKMFFNADLDKVMSTPFQNGIPGTVNSYILYSVFLSGAMILAAIGISGAGRWDSEEKTTLPVKK